MEDYTYSEGGFTFPNKPTPIVPNGHPLRQHFAKLVERSLLTGIGVYDSQIADYLVDVLSNFTHVRGVYSVRDLSGKPLQEVADMLLQADIRLNAVSFNREREVHKHIGDFALFWTGIYPEASPRMQESTKFDHLIDYVKQGKSSYAIAATHDYGSYQSEAQVLKRLSDDFEVCMLGLNLVRQEMDKLPNQRGTYLGN